MINNKAIADYILNKIESFGFIPYDVRHPDGYFLFEGSEYSVVHFKVTGVWSNWLFGMWIHSEYLDEEYVNEHKKEYTDSYKWPVVEIFCQHEHNINKFKPTASEICISYDVDDWNGKDKWENTFWELEGMLKMLQRHPLMCYNSFCGRHAGYYGSSFLGQYMKWEFQYYWREIKEHVLTWIWLPYTKAKLFLCSKSKCINKIELHDFEKENPGWSTSYLYNVIVDFREDSSDKDQCKWVSRWFHRDKYGRFDKYGYDYVIEIEYRCNGKYIGFD